MSLDLLLTAYHFGDPCPLDPDILNRYLVPHTVEQIPVFGSPPYRGKSFLMNYGGRKYGWGNLSDHLGFLCGFGINRPPFVLPFFNDLWAILSHSPTLIYGDVNRCACGSEATLPHIPSDFIKFLGPPVIAHSGEELAVGLFGPNVFG
jgi:hypothetical protein